MVWRVIQFLCFLPNAFLSPSPQMSLCRLSRDNFSAVESTKWDSVTIILQAYTCCTISCAFAKQSTNNNKENIQPTTEKKAATTKYTWKHCVASCKHIDIKHVSSAIALALPLSLSLRLYYSWSNRNKYMYIIISVRMRLRRTVASELATMS